MIRIKFIDSKFQINN